jgi:hypothetical protein
LASYSNILSTDVTNIHNIFIFRTNSEWSTAAPSEEAPVTGQPEEEATMEEGSTEEGAGEGGSTEEGEGEGEEGAGEGEEGAGEGEEETPLSCHGVGPYAR